MDIKTNSPAEPVKANKLSADLTERFSLGNAVELQTLPVSPHNHNICGGFFFRLLEIDGNLTTGEAIHPTTHPTIKPA